MHYEKGYYLFHLAFLGLTACVSKQEITSSWVSPDIVSGVVYKKVFVAALTDDLDAKNFVEKSVSEKLVEMGTSVVRSVDVFPPNFSAFAEIVQEEKLQAIRETGSDAILTLTLLDVITEERYHPETPHMIIEREPLYFYRSYFPYYQQRYSVVYTPSYYTDEKTYFIESNLYDASSEKLVWSVQSAVFNPLDLSDWCQGYSKVVLEQLKNDGLLGP